jgi:hypothetical protein
MFDKETLSKEPRSLQLLLDSFRVSSGSPIAHTLFERAYAIEQHISFEEVTTVFLDMYAHLDENEKRTLNLEMAKLHLQNPNAKKVVRREIEETESDLNTVMHDQLPRKADMSDLETKIKRAEMTVEKLDEALKKAYSLSPESDRVKNLQAIAGFLGLYNGQTWWHALGEPRQNEIKTLGAHFFT